MHRQQSDSEEWIKTEIQEADKSTYKGEGKKQGGWLKREVNIIRTVKSVKHASYEILPFNICNYTKSLSHPLPQPSLIPAHGCRTKSSTSPATSWDSKHLFVSVL